MCTHKDTQGNYTYYIKEAGDLASGSFQAICRKCGDDISEVVDDD